MHHFHDLPRLFISRPYADLRTFFATAGSQHAHTFPPNREGPDCISHTSNNSGHFGARSYHAGGINVLFGDGSVHFINNGINFPTWKALGTRGGGEAFDATTF